MCLDTHWKHSDEFMNRSHNNHQMFETSMHRFNVEESLKQNEQQSSSAQIILVTRYYYVENDEQYNHQWASM